MARSLYRSVTYGLDASLALAQAVALSGGRTDAGTLASALSYSGVRNGAFLSRLANARLFGLVAGRSGQVVLTERGRHCLSADPAAHRVALAEACWAVPLFQRVLQDASGTELGDVDELAGVLETRFGEDSSKCRTTARVLLESAGRAGLLRSGKVDLSLVRGHQRILRIPIPTLDACVRTIGTIALEPACEAGQAPRSAFGRQGGCIDGRWDVELQRRAERRRGRPVARRGDLIVAAPHEPSSSRHGARGGGVCSTHRYPGRASGHLRIHTGSPGVGAPSRHREWRRREALRARRLECHDGLGELRLHLPVERIALRGQHVDRRPKLQRSGVPGGSGPPEHRGAGIGHHRHQPDGNGSVGCHQLERSERAPGRGAGGSHNSLGGGRTPTTG